LLRIKRASGAFEFSDGVITIDSNKEEISQGGGALEIFYVTAVKEVEATIGKHHFATSLGCFFSKEQKVWKHVNGWLSGWVHSCCWIHL